MYQLLKIKHWQLFSLLFAIPFLFQMVMMGIVTSSNDPTVFLFSFPFLITYVLGLYFAWFYVLGVNLHKKLPQTVNLSLGRFKFFLFAPVVYAVFLFVFMFVTFSDMSVDSQIDPLIFLWILPFHFFAVYCIFYCLYFVAKSLKSVELQRPVDFNDYAGEFFLIWFYPIGLWFIQPRINKLFDSNNNL
jgi:hypothetical protein